MESTTQDNPIVETSTKESTPVPEGAAQESLESQPHGGALKRSRIPTYKGFDGRYRKLDEIRDRLPAFREFYLKVKFESAGAKISNMKIVDMFNDSQADDMPKDFFPQQAMYARWRKQWDAEQSGLIKNAETRLAERDARRIVIPGETSIEQLEESMNTLGAELANDAMQTLRDTQDREEYFEDEVVVKRKQYALNVFAYIVKAAHSKAALKLKAQGEARETAGFMLDLIRRAAAGNLTQAEVELLRGSVRVEHNYGNERTAPSSVS